MKQCTKCNIEKELSLFPKNKRFNDGYNSICKNCINLLNKAYRLNNLIQFKESRKKHYINNVDRMRQYKRENSRKHTEKKALYDSIYRKNNSDSIKNYKKQWEYKHKNDPIFKIKRNLRRRINHVIKSNNKSNQTFELIGCTPEQFKKHIESQFVDNMSWDNYGPNGWHIDHIIPCYTFDLSDKEQQRKCFHYTNQRPLWAKDNMSRKRSS